LLNAWMSAPTVLPVISRRDRLSFSWILPSIVLLVTLDEFTEESTVCVVLEGIPGEKAAENELHIEMLFPPPGRDDVQRLPQLSMPAVRILIDEHITQLIDGPVLPVTVIQQVDGQVFQRCHSNAGGADPHVTEFRRENLAIVEVTALKPGLPETTLHVVIQIGIAAAEGGAERELGLPRKLRFENHAGIGRVGTSESP